MADKQRLITRYHLTQDALNRKVSDAHILAIQQTISWREVGKHLLKKVDMDDIKRDGFDGAERRDMMLAKWQERSGSDATYDKLINAMISARKIEEAEGVCQLISPGNGAPPQPVPPQPVPVHPVGLGRGDRPTLPKMDDFPGTRKTFSIIQRIGTSSESFGIQLLNDEEGETVSAIQQEHRGVAADINRAIIGKWLRGEGREPVTWQTLVDVLGIVKLRVLGRDISEALSP